MVYKVMRDEWVKAEKVVYHVVNEETGVVKKTFKDKAAAQVYAQELNAYGERK